MENSDLSDVQSNIFDGLLNSGTSKLQTIGANP
jgi:hypothetical protein